MLFFFYISWAWSRPHYPLGVPGNAPHPQVTCGVDGVHLMGLETPYRWSYGAAGCC